MKQTLWILEYVMDGRGNLVPFYAESEAEAYGLASLWAMRRGIPLGGSKITQFPSGFRAFRSQLPGTIETPIDEGTQKGDSAQ
jgi:hypothetical protein